MLKPLVLGFVLFSLPVLSQPVAQGGQGVACNLVTRDDAEQIFGGPLNIGDSTPDMAVGSVPSRDLSECQFWPMVPEDKPPTDERLTVTVYFAPFQTGDWETIARHMSADPNDLPVREISGLNGTALWHFKPAPGAYGNLWVLNGKVQIFTLMEGIDDEAKALELTKAIAAIALSRIETPPGGLILR